MPGMAAAVAAAAEAAAAPSGLADFSGEVEAEDDATLPPWSPLVVVAVVVVVVLLLVLVALLLPSNAPTIAPSVTSPGLPVGVACCFVFFFDPCRLSDLPLPLLLRELFADEASPATASQRASAVLPPASAPLAPPLSAAGGGFLNRCSSDCMVQGHEGLLKARGNGRWQTVSSSVSSWLASR
jgi:hypothetical protein